MGAGREREGGEGDGWSGCFPPPLARGLKPLDALQEYKAALDAVGLEKVALQRQLGVAQEDRQQAQEELAAAREELSRLGGQLGQAEDSLSSHRRALAEAEDRLSALQAVQEAAAKAGVSIEQLGDLRLAMEARSLADAQAEVEQLRARLADSEAQVEALQQAKKELQSLGDAVSFRDGQISALKEEIEVVEHVMEERVHVAEDQRDALAAREQEEGAELAAARQEADALRARLASAEQELEEAAAGAEAGRHQAEELRHRCSALEAALDDRKVGSSLPWHFATPVHGLTLQGPLWLHRPRLPD